MGNPATATQTENKTTTSNPWEAQAPFLQQGFQAASAGLQNAQSQPGPNQFVSQYTPEQLGAFRQMLGYGTGNPAIAGNSAAAGGALTGAGANATTGALSGLSNYAPGSTSDAILADAEKFSNNPQVGGMVDAAMRDARRSVSEQVLPSIGRNAAATGNINSNKTAIREGLVERGLADATADTSANIRGNLYSQGLNLAQNNLSQNDAARLGALSTAASAGTGAVGTGVGANSGAVQQQSGLFDIANAGVTGQQAGSQAAINDILARYGFNVDKGFQGLDQFWNVVGGNNWGGTSNSTGTTTGTKRPSTLSQIGQAAGIAGSILSDRRMKQDIMCIGRLHNGLPVYSFAYKHDPYERHMGVMAQDVELVIPEAVTEKDGIKYVDYSLVLIGA